MSNPVLNPSSICQVALVVDDIHRVAQNYAKVFGLPMPVIIESDPPEESGIRYRGQPTAARAKLAFFNLGPLTLELIEPNDQPSTWRETLEKTGPGLHHIAFQVPNARQTSQQLAEFGAPVIQTGSFKTGNYTYLDASRQLGTVLELLEIYPTPK